MLTPATETDGLALAKSIGKHVLPIVMRNWADLVLSSDDPRTHKDFVEVVHKLEGKEMPSGTLVNLTINLDSSPVFDIQTVEEVTPAQTSTSLDAPTDRGADDLRFTESAPDATQPSEEEAEQATAFLDLFDLSGAIPAR